MSRTRLYANTTCSGVSLQDKVFGSGGTPDNFKVLEAVTLTDGVAGHYIELSAPNPNPTQFRYGVFAIDNSRLCFNDIFVNWGALIPVFESGSWSPLQQQKNKVPLTLEYDAGLINSAVVKSDCFTSGNL